MGKPIVIGLLGRSKSGKDYVCKDLMNLFEKIKEQAVYGIEDVFMSRYGLADFLKEIVAEANGITVSELENRKEEFRQRLIDVSENVLKRHDKAFFAKKFDTDRVKVATGTMIHIITDVRYQGEHNHFLNSEEYDYFPVKVSAPEHEKQGCGFELEEAEVSFEFLNDRNNEMYKFTLTSLIAFIKGLIDYNRRIYEN